jgi:protein ImuB
VAIADTQTAARLLARHRAGLTVIEPGAAAAALAPLPVSLLADIVRTPNPELRTPYAERSEPRTTRTPNDPSDLVRTFRRWGLRTLDEVASLPAAEVASRLGQDGVLWQRLARGEDPRPLVPSQPEECFEQTLDLEWPIEGLEPLSFVLGRLLEPLSEQLERGGRGAAALRVRLHLVTREIHERSLRFPVPMRGARALGTLALLDLDSNPPAAAIDRVTVAVDPTPGRILQFSLLARPLPVPERVATLMARLQALMGETRCGSPALVDSWRPGAFTMKPFAPVDPHAVRPHEPRRRGDAENTISPRPMPHAIHLHEPRRPGEVVQGIRNLRASVSPRFVAVNEIAQHPIVALRRFRIPVPARVRVEHDRPVLVVTDRRGVGGGRVVTSAGPWRTSGDWWREGWDRDEWDVSLGDGATYRVFRTRGADAWFIEGIVD